MPKQRVLRLRTAVLVLVSASVSITLYFGTAAYFGGRAYAVGEWSYWYGRTTDLAKRLVVPVRDSVGDDEYGVLRTLLNEWSESESGPILLSSLTFWPSDEKDHLEELVADRPQLLQSFVARNNTSHAYRVRRLLPGADVQTVPIALLETPNGRDRFDSRYRTGLTVTVFSRVAFDSDGDFALVYLERRNAASCFRSGYYLLHRTGSAWETVDGWETYS